MIGHQRSMSPSEVVRRLRGSWAPCGAGRGSCSLSLRNCAGDEGVVLHVRLVEGVDSRPVQQPLGLAGARGPRRTRPSAAPRTPACPAGSRTTPRPAARRTCRPPSPGTLKMKELKWYSCTARSMAASQLVQSKRDEVGAGHGTTPLEAPVLQQFLPCHGVHQRDVVQPNPAGLLAVRGPDAPEDAGDERDARRRAGQRR